MRNFEESNSEYKNKNPSAASARETAQRAQRAPVPNPDRSPTKEKGPVKEPKKGEPMVLTAERLNEKNGVKPLTSTDVAAGKPRTSTVTDGEAG